MSWVFNPVVSLTGFSVVLLFAHPTWVRADLVFWALLAAVPAAILAAGVFRGVWTDPDLTNLRERRTFLPWAAGSAIVLAIWSVVGGFPGGLRFAAVAIAVWLVLISVVSLGWKISIHEGATVGVILLLAVLVGWGWGLTLLWAPFVVAWARLRLRKHTAAQLLAGAAAAVSALILAGQMAPP